MYFVGLKFVFVVVEGFYYFSVVLVFDDVVWFIMDFDFNGVIIIVD